MIENTLPRTPVLDTPVTPITPTPVAPKAKIPGLLLGLIIGVLLTTTAASAYYFFVYQKNTSSDIQTDIFPTLPPIVSPSPTISETPAESTRFGQLTWMDAKAISQLVIFKNSSSDFYGNSANWGKFYQVGSFSDGSKLIIGQIPVDGPSDSGAILRFIQRPDNSLNYITTGLDSWTLETFQSSFIPQLNPIDIQLSGLQSPDVISQNKLFFNKDYSTNYLFSKLVSPIKILDSQYGPIYEVIKPNIISGVDISGKQFYLKLKDSTLVSYQLTDNGEPNKGIFQPSITWSDNSTSTVTLTQNIIMSCGSGGIVTPFIKDSSSLIFTKIQVGKTSKNEAVFQIMDENNALVKALYENYKTGRDSSSEVLTLSQFASKHNHVLIKDSMGDWLVYANQDFAPLAECGKPVIYLYPTKDTLTTVKVGAKITKSEPLYPQNGWTVLAHPNGQLDYQNKIYPNLFWEGTGLGFYPNPTNYGFVVAQKDLIPTLKSQLTQLGLNSQESADFMDFWTEKLPTTPYIRLTWLGTADMNKLAPLSVIPKPDTTIRIFLDFAGLDKPIKLIPQKLSAPPRLGFTLVEWGGLLVK